MHRFLEGETGQLLVEYALVGVFVSIVAVGLLHAIGIKVEAFYSAAVGGF